MNEWSEKTLKLVTSENYLDRLQEIYPHEDAERDVHPTILESIRESFVSKDNAGLLDKLLNLDRFPYKDSYVGFLRKDRTAIQRNPETVTRICDRLYSMGVEGVIQGATSPKEANTRRGNQFRDWLKSKFSVVDMDAFRSSKTGIVALGGSELEGRNFCNTDMGVGISKRPDLVAKTAGKYVVGEAKFLSSAGGNQGRAFDDGITVSNNSSGIALKVFILDGIHWIETGSEQFKKIQYGSTPILSALLLEEYLKSVV